MPDMEAGVLKSADPKEVAGPEALADLVVIVIGDNHCWGRGDTLEEAIKNASRPRKYVAYICKPDTKVSELDGSLSWTCGFAPKLISSRGVRVKK